MPVKEQELLCRLCLDVVPLKQNNPGDLVRLSRDGRTRVDAPKRDGYAFWIPALERRSCC